MQTLPLKSSPPSALAVWKPEISTTEAEARLALIARMFAGYPSSKPDVLTLSAYVDATAVLTAKELADSIQTSVARSPTWAPTAAELVYGRLEVGGDTTNTHLTAEECARDRLYKRRLKVRARRDVLIALQCGPDARVLAVVDRIGKGPF